MELCRLCPGRHAHHNRGLLEAHVSHETQVFGQGAPSRRFRVRENRRDAWLDGFRFRPTSMLSRLGQAFLKLDQLGTCPVRFGLEQRLDRRYVRLRSYPGASASIR